MPKPKPVEMKTLKPLETNVALPKASEAVAERMYCWPLTHWMPGKLQAAGVPWAGNVLGQGAVKFASRGL